MFAPVVSFCCCISSKVIALRNVSSLRRFPSSDLKVFVNNISTNGIATTASRFSAHIPFNITLIVSILLIIAIVFIFLFIWMYRKGKVIRKKIIDAAVIEVYENLKKDPSFSLSLLRDRTSQVSDSFDVEIEQIASRMQVMVEEGRRHSEMVKNVVSDVENCLVMLSKLEMEIERCCKIASRASEEAKKLCKTAMAARDSR